MENETYSTVLGNTSGAPYQNQLASQCGVPTNMYSESHGSLINYMSATNGQSIATNIQFVTHDDCAPNTTFCNSTSPSIFSQIDGTPGESWKGYAEDMPSNCYQADAGNYAVRHNPETYYRGLASCGQFDVPMGNVGTQTGAFYSDVQAGSLPSFSFISPNLIDDAHSSSTTVGDTWLSKIVPLITAGANYQSGDTAIFITNDEGGAGTPDHVIGEDCANPALAPSQPSCHIPTIVVSPYTKANSQDGTFYTHYSMLRTTEELLGLPLLGLAASANSMAAAFNLGPTGTGQPPGLQPVTNLAATAASSTQINVTWSASALATGYNIVRNGVQVGTTTGTSFADTGLTAGISYSYSIVATDGSGDTAVSHTVSATTVGTVRQWITNQSLETDMSGWSGLYNGTSANSRTTPGYDGTYSLRSVNKSATVGTNGFSDKPHWISGTSTGSTTAGTIYTGSLWVKADTVGQKITLFLRELNAAGAGVNKAPYNVGVTVTATSTNWFNITENYPAVATGDAISFIVYGSNMPAGSGFDSDLIGLTSPTGNADTIPPSVPTNVTAVPISQSQVSLSWTAATDNVGVVSYIILRNGTKVGNTAATSFSDVGLSAGTAYGYSVIAMDAANNSGPAATVTATTPPVLGTPTNLAAQQPSGTEVDLSWTPALGAINYNVQRNGVAIAVATTTQYADLGLTVNSSYTYTVIATDGYGDTTASTPLQVTTSNTPPPPPLSLCGNPAATSRTPIQHVLIVMLENHSYQQVVGAAAAPYQTSLATECGSATSMFGTTHTSAADYLAASAGEFPTASRNGCGSIKGCGDPSSNVYHQLDTAGLTWRSYEESMPTTCSSVTSGTYKIGHNPSLFYSDIPLAECQARDLPVASLTAQSGALWNDLQAQTLPSVSWVSPNTADDGDAAGSSTASLAAADSWLAGFLATVQQSASYQAGNTLVLVTYDEGSGTDATTGEDCTNQTMDLPIINGISSHQDSCHVPLFVIYPYTAAGTSDNTFFDHYSLTKTVEDIFGMPYLAHAADPQTTSLLGHFSIG